MARFPYAKPRRGQLEAARAIVSTVREGGVFVLSAPTGFGKTSTIIYGLLEAGVERILYVVRTRNEIAPVLRELRRFGVERYSFLYSARRMCPLLAGEQLATEDFWETCRLLRLRGECMYHENLVEVSEETVEAIVTSIGESKPSEVVAALRNAGLCPFFSLRLASTRAAITVATYPYLFREDIFTSVFEPLTYGDFVVVVDEAHSLLTIQSMLEARLTLETLRAALDEIEEYGLPGELTVALKKLLDMLSSSTAPRMAMKRLEKNKIRDILAEPDLWLDAAQEVRAAKLRERLEQGAPVKLSVALTRVANFAAMVFREDTGVYLRKENGRRVLIALPVEPCSVTEKPLNEAKAVILSSGTMPASSILRDVLCIRKPMKVYEVELLHGHIFPPENIYTVLALEITSRYTSRSREMYARYAEYIAETFRAVRNAVLIVYPSYEFMEAILSHLKHLLSGEPMVVEGRDTSIEQVEEYVRRHGHVAIHAVAGGKLTEGIEIVENGESLIKTVFVAGVPYPQPDDYVADQYEVLAKRMGTTEAKTFLYDYTAAVKTRQAVGRVRRSEKDRALIILGDVRFARRRLREYLRLRIDAYAATLEDYVARVRAAAEKLKV
ncbi:ATP-dependent DNA helicase [Hyperthermus butylicus]|uniref:XPD/Rad3 related DNA helicase n=1 Tax=Hyperthermus butylicus (strain DSM 5456 / JCM 9403 / PLM1-5) TaxID=415426 RepID=A2BIY0_HYPBU|nr:ATP-dependent DNA helicase [Hyperthermus butylicus]ABM79941.1 XPD/Rad3 related DNA helicase [Hyperthermus butylicus DSM 5456]